MNLSEVSKKELCDELAKREGAKLWLMHDRKQRYEIKRGTLPIVIGTGAYGILVVTEE